MENLIENQNLVVHIGQNILDCLDDDIRKSCRLVNSSMKNMVDNPKYWIHKLLKKGIDQEHLNSWRTLTYLVENTDLKDNLNYMPDENVSKIFLMVSSPHSCRK